MTRPAACQTRRRIAFPAVWAWFGLFSGMAVWTVVAQDPEPEAAQTTRIYMIRGRAPSDVRRMLLELNGESPDAQVVASDQTSELTVTGPAAVHLMAKQLVSQLNSDTDTAESSKREDPLPVLPTPDSQNAGFPWPESISGKGGSTSQAANAFEPEPAQPRSRQALRIPASREPVPVASDSDQRHSESASESEVVVALSFMKSSQAESGIRRILGNRLVRKSGHRFEYSAGSRRSVIVTFDSDTSEVRLSGTSALVDQFEILVRSLDEANTGSGQRTRVVPLNTTDPEVLDRALKLWRKTRQSGRDSEEDGHPSHSFLDRGSAFRTAGFQQIPGEPAIPIESGEPTDSPPPSSETPETDGDLLRRPSSDVTVEPLQDLDVLILRGRDPDVEELVRIIQEIERLSEETAPEIEVVYLQHVQGEALEELVSEVLADLTGPLQGRVSITPLVKPNALLLIGWGEAVAAAKKLIARLDESVEPQTQMELFSLKNASASQVSRTIEQFLNGRGGLAPEVSVEADSRTNTLIVNAAPRDLAEVRKLIERLDAETSESVNQARIVTLRNALATDVSQTITQALTAARGGSGSTRNAALELLISGPDGQDIVASGLLDDVKLTPDSRTNRIFITGPPETVPLIEHLIRTFDETPAATAQIKVFQITNGDATDLVQLLRSLFPEQAATSAVPQLATSADESSLVPVRFSVDVRTNSIIATGTAGDLQIIEALLLRLDEADSQERVNKVYRLKNSPALDVANAVNNFLRSERIVNQAAPGRQNPFAQIESEVVVVPEPVGNALIISATPRYFEQIMELVEGLDAQPPQVMIQVILAEVELDNLNEFGVELGLQDSLLFDRSLLGSILTPGYNFNNQPLGNAGSAQSLATRGKVGGQALSHFSVGRTSADTEYGGLVLSASSENVSVLLRAMNQSRNMEILSRPQIMTLDNQPAFIQVGQRVPRIVGTSINQVGQVNSVELENVGLILGVTPRISPEGMVVMEIDAEKSDVGAEIDGIPVSVSADGEVIRSPRVNITTAQTTVSAASGQTIVIGGLITSNNATTARRIPWLSDVPVLGHFFRFDSSASNRRELLIILTPHVVRGESEAEYLKQVEMARMSWISCDVFNWMNTDTPVTGTMDSEVVPTVYPDETPGITALEAALPATQPESLRGLKRVAAGSHAGNGKQRGAAGRDHTVSASGVVSAAFESDQPSATSPPAGEQQNLPTRVVVPNWKILRSGEVGSEVADFADPSTSDVPVAPIRQQPSAMDPINKSSERPRIEKPQPKSEASAKQRRSAAPN